ncbi:pseudouridine synthase [Hylemonella gracilis]|jgi:16S rRNA pseudouridine516 synthase|uniref:Pseudouridine synthase n=1 Tax=Hylemonella gracilis TaxID=80880 RepID=A0A4P6UMM2_9BURK|nr:16S rRNA pseudouridine(516) synthase [Hylemonella gracilis]QBK06512.1 pseudouridine synthase [Hylemonella gracilis]
MQLQDILYGQGFGARRVCAGLVQQGRVHVAGAPCIDPFAEFEPEGLHLRVEGLEGRTGLREGGLDWVCHLSALIMLNKPAGYECSQKPSAWPSVYTLLPLPLRQRPAQAKKGATAGVQAVGRLDQDTTGLLLLTDDGQVIHKLASPRHKVPKVYEVGLKHPVLSPADAPFVQRLLDGVVLDDDPQPVRAAACELLTSQHLRLTLTDGKYHQVKRMVAAVGNRVEVLHRSRIGELRLPEEMAPGQWRWLEMADRSLLGL